MNLDNLTQEEPKKKNLHAGHRKRLRELFNSKGWENLQEHQVLEYLLSCVQPRKDTNPLAHELIDKFGSFTNVLDAKPEDLQLIDGVGEQISTFITCIPHIFKYYKSTKKPETICCKCAKDVNDNFGKRINHMPYEELHILCLDSKSNVILNQMINKGTNNSVSVTLKEINELVVRTKASAFILIHNHPNEDCRPSKEDINMTRKICFSNYINGVYLTDHLIVCKDNSFFSFANAGLLNDYEKEITKLIGNEPKFKNKPPEYKKDNIGDN